MEIPQLAEGEIYCGAIIKADGTGHHIILLPGDNDDASWDDQMAWAKSIGGDLPDRAEQALFYQYMPEEFHKDFYWSNQQHESRSGFAWGQYFLDGYQSYRHKVIIIRARAVRRVAV
jgi:hypothetical protein